ncbi:MAG TPA: hypothetical protein VMB34_31755 [Acetobacteraceae bacterium]|nr:hypothetical protein [Acetobacteraceae bacterium]
MLPAEDRLERLLLFCIPAVIVLLGCGAGMLRPDAVIKVLDFLAAWTFASIPLAVLVGHCTMDRE